MSRDRRSCIRLLLYYYFRILLLYRQSFIYFYCISNISISGRFFPKYINLNTKTEFPHRKYFSFLDFLIQSAVFFLEDNGLWQLKILNITWGEKKTINTNLYLDQNSNSVHYTFKHVYSKKSFEMITITINMWTPHPPI